MRFIALGDVGCALLCGGTGRGDLRVIQGGHGPVPRSFGRLPLAGDAAATCMMTHRFNIAMTPEVRACV